MGLVFWFLGNFKGGVDVQATDAASVDVLSWMMRAIATTIVIAPMLKMLIRMKNCPVPKRSWPRTKNGRMKTRG
jgi:hypothetical protein